MKTILLKSWLVMVCMLVFGVGSAWADSFTISFKDNGSDATTALTSSSFKDQVSAGASYISSVSTSNCFAGTGGIKMSSNNNNGDFTLTLDQSYSITSVVLNVENKNATTKTVKVGETAFTTSDEWSDSEFKDLTFTGTKTKSNSLYVSLAGTTNKKRVAYIASITVYYEAEGGSTAPKYDVNVLGTIANGTVTANPTSAAAGATVSLTATPASGYEFGSWNVTNASTNAAITVTNNQFTMPAANVNVSATFNAIQGGGDGDSELTYGYFVKITSQADIVDGGKYLIVREETSSAFAAGIQPNTDTKYLTVNAIAKGGSYTGNVNQTNSPYVYTLKSSNDGYFYLINNKNYLTGASSSTNITLNNSVSTQSYSDWKLTVNQQKNVTIQNKAAKSGSGSSATLREIRYNTGNPARFADYASGTGSVVTLYKWIPTATITIASACTDGKTCYSTYSNASAWIVPEGLTVSTVGVNNESKLVVNNYNEGDVVAANTGVMVSGTAGDHVVTLTDAAATNAPGTNALHPSSEAMTGDNLFYRLTMHNGTQIGFWWGAEDGGAFSLDANKAYLAVPGKNQVRMWFGEDESAISSLVEENAAGAVIYNLSGQRIQKMQKGINIVNGKKYIVK